MHIIGKIDKNIYKCIAEDIVTDELVITDKQLLHIQERHPEAYENTIEYVKEIVQSPDYIIEDEKHADSGLIIKKVSLMEEYFLLVLRICTAKDPEGYKNSIITSWEISEKRLQNYIKNKKVLYKKN